MTPGRLTLAAYTHFGAPSLKGAGMYYLVRDVWKRGLLDKVIAVSKRKCQYDFDLDLVDTLPGEGLMLNALGRLPPLWGGLSGRTLPEALFDRYAATRLPASGGILVVTPRLAVTTRRGKALGYRTCLYGGSPDPRCLLREIETERAALGLPKESSGAARARQMEQYRRQIGALDYVLTISDFAKETFVEAGFPPDRVFVSPLGVDLQRFPASPAPVEPLTFLFTAHVLGATGIVKGLRYVLEAWAELELPDARLVVCGKIGDESEEVVRRFQGRLRNVEFVGGVQNPADYYRRSSVFLYTNVTGGFGKVVLEAMSSGRAVIGTPIPKPVLRDGVDGFYVPTRDVSALKEKMRYFHDHREEVTRMGANAAERAKSFGWEQFSGRVADILEGLGP
jgi:hypothetical protein